MSMEGYMWMVNELMICVWIICEGSHSGWFRNNDLICVTTTKLFGQL